MSEFTFHGRGILKRVETFTSKAGKEMFTLIFEQGGQYPQTVPIKVFGYLAERAGDWVPGCELAVTGRLGGREYNGRVYGDAVANSVEVIGEAKPAGAVTNDGPPPVGDDDVPF